MKVKQTTSRSLALGAALSCSLGFALSEPTVNTVVVNQLNTPDPNSDMVEIQGKVDAAQGITSLDINGYTTSTFDGKAFSVLMPQASDYQFNLYGAPGEYQVVNYSDTTVPVDSAVQIVVGNQLLADVGPALGTLLTDLDLNDVLGIDPEECVVDTIFLLGCDLYLEELAIHGTPDIDLSFSPVDAQELTVNIHVGIPEAALSTKIRSALLFWTYRDTTITTEDINLDFQIGVKATENQSIKLVIDEASDVHLSIGKMHVDSNRLAPHLIPLFKDVIALIINQHVANIAGPFLDHLPIPAIPINLPIDIDGDDVNDAEFAIKMGAEVLDVLDNNDGLAVLGGTISSTTVVPGREVIGTRRIGSNAPPPATLTAPTDIDAALAVDLVNQVLTAVYQSGIEEKLAIGLTVADLGDFGLILFNLFGYSLEDPINARLSFGSAPILLANNSSMYPLGIDTGLTKLRLLLLDFDEDGNEEVLLDFTTDVVIDTSLGAESDGSLHLEFTDFLTLSDLEVNGGKLVDEFDFPREALAYLLTIALPGLVAGLEPTINDLLNSVRLELDIGETLSAWLDTEFPSVPVEGYITETGVSDDESYLSVGVGIDFPE
jgi:hypothetical protein